jgi:hypothetical protein
MKPTDGLSIAAILAKELYGETLEDHENLFMEAFEKELATLPEVNRIAIHLRFFEKLPYRECAVRMGCGKSKPFNAVKSGLRKLRHPSKCRRMLEVINMHKFESVPSGLLCPWCVNTLIHDCKHNPFKLMDRIKQLENEECGYCGNWESTEERNSNIGFCPGLNRKVPRTFMCNFWRKK